MMMDKQFKDAVIYLMFAVVVLLFYLAMGPVVSPIVELATPFVVGCLIGLALMQLLKR